MARLAVLHERYYCPLSLSVFDRNEYGGLKEEGYGLSGAAAAQYEDQIRELLKKEHSYLSFGFLKYTDVSFP